MKDKEKLMKTLVKSKIVYANMNFSGIHGLKYYDDGYVREGSSQSSFYKWNCRILYKSRINNHGIYTWDFIRTSGYESALAYGSYLGALIDNKYKFIFIGESVPGNNE